LPDGQGFRESSSSWHYRVWKHERRLLDAPDGCIVRDCVEIEPKLAFLDPLVARSVARMFRLRHRRLRRRFRSQSSGQ
jgi:ligand-binding SRPBCC domain-containing protein